MVVMARVPAGQQVPRRLGAWHGTRAHGREQAPAGSHGGTLWHGRARAAEERGGASRLGTGSEDTAPFGMGAQGTGGEVVQRWQGASGGRRHPGCATAAPARTGVKGRARA